MTLAEVKQGARAAPESQQSPHVSGVLRYFSNNHVVPLLLVREGKVYSTAFAALTSASVVCRSRKPSRKTFARITPF